MHLPPIQDSSLPPRIVTVDFWVRNPDLHFWFAHLWWWDVDPVHWWNLSWATESEKTRIKARTALRRTLFPTTPSWRFWTFVFLGVFFFPRKWLGGGNSKISCKTPIPGEDYYFDQYLSNGLVQPPTRFRWCLTDHEPLVCISRWKTEFEWTFICESECSIDICAIFGWS